MRLWLVQIEMGTGVSRQVFPKSEVVWTIEAGSCLLFRSCPSHDTVLLLISFPHFLLVIYRSPCRRLPSSVHVFQELLTAILPCCVNLQWGNPFQAIPPAKKEAATKLSIIVRKILSVRYQRVFCFASCRKGIVRVRNPFCPSRGENEQSGIG